MGTKPGGVRASAAQDAGVLQRADVLDGVPQATLEWLLAEDNPAVAVLTRRTLLGEPDDATAAALWARRNEYAPLAAVLDQQLEDGSWAPPPRDYQKYWGSLWQVHFLGELHANPDDERVQRAAEYAFSRQLDDGSWSCSNARAKGSIPCLTANVGRALARLGFATDKRVVRGLEYCVTLRQELGQINCWQAVGYQLNGYCHMVIPKLLLYLAEVPRDVWPKGAEELLDEAVAKMRGMQVHRCLPEESKEFQDILWTAKTDEREGLREKFLSEHPELHYKEKPGWMRFGYPLSYNSDALESLAALAAVGETMRPEYSDAVELVRSTVDSQMRWKLRNTFNGKMLADIEAKGQPSKWLTLRALQVLEWAQT